MAASIPMMFRRLIVAAAISFAAVAVSPAGGSFAADAVPSAALRSKAPDAAKLLEKASKDRVVRVIVTLRTPGGAAAPQGTTKADDARRKADTSAAIDGFLGRLMGTPSISGAESSRYAARRMTFVPMVSLTVTTADLERIAKDADVVSIVENVAVPPTLTQSVPLIGMKGVWPNGGEGDGTIIAVLDTGVQIDHPFLNGRVLGQACYSSNVPDNGAYTSTSFCPGGAETGFGDPSGQNCPYPSLDACLHGTHVAGIAAGFQTTGLPPAGVALDAAVFAVQVFSFFPNQSSSFQVLSWSDDQLAALDYLYGQRNSMPGGRRLASINMSLGGGQFFAPCTADPLRSTIQLLRTAGIATVISAGNSGFTSSMGAPGCVPEAVSVASSTKSDGISSFSNIASFTTLIAPGSDIVSSIPGSAFESLSGTSMAAPHVAGAIASLMSAAPSATLEEIVTSLVSTGKPIADDRAGGTVTKNRICVADALADLGVAVGNLQLSPNAVVFQRRGSAITPASVDLTITSPSDTMAWSLDGLPAWLTASMTSGEVTAGTPEKVKLTVVAPATQTEDLKANLSVQKVSCSTAAKIVPVTLKLVPPTLAVSPSGPIVIGFNKKGNRSPSEFKLAVTTSWSTAEWKLTNVPAWLVPNTTTGKAKRKPKSKVTFTVKEPKKPQKGDLVAKLRFTQLKPGNSVVLVKVTLKAPAKNGKDEAATGSTVVFEPVATAE